MSKHKAPWYIWFSFFAFGVLWFNTMARIIITKNRHLRNSALGNLFKLSVVFIILPMLVVVLLYSVSLSIFSISTSESLADYIFTFILLLSMYFCGVCVAYGHIIWRRENMSHLVGNKRQQDDNDERDDL